VISIEAKGIKCINELLSGFLVKLVVMVGRMVQTMGRFVVSNANNYFGQIQCLCRDSRQKLLSISWYMQWEREKEGKLKLSSNLVIFHFSIYGLKSNLSINGHNFVNTFQRITDFFQWINSNDCKLNSKEWKVTLKTDTEEWFEI
jgi:hypothetical protein